MEEPVKVADIGSYTRQDMKSIAIRMLDRQAVRRRITFEGGATIRAMLLEDVYHSTVTFDNVTFVITNVMDTWTPEKGFVREITADAQLPNA